MNKLSIKLGFLFFMVVSVFSFFILFILHEGIVEQRVMEVMEDMQNRGDAHSQILTMDQSQRTIEHIVLMEESSISNIVLTDGEQNIVNTSIPSNSFLSSFIENNKFTGEPTKKNMLSENETLITMSAVGNDYGIVQYVYMIQEEQYLHLLVHKLNDHFLIAGVLTLLFTLLAGIFLTKRVTTPLIDMTHATEKIREGDYQVTLEATSKDELGQLAKGINSLASELAYYKKSRNEFLASVSHEIKTPLTYIKGYAEVLRKTEGEDKQRYTDIIVNESKRLAQLTEDLISLSKHESLDLKLDLEEVVVEEFIQDYAEKANLMVSKEKGIVTVNANGKNVVRVDVLRLEQILTNLMDNALKYSKDSLEVTLTVTEKGNQLAIIVEDNGIGIPKTDLPNIFEKFYRVDKSRTRKLGGSGLGLSVVKDLVQKQGGTVEIESTFGKGTKITLLFRKVVTK